MADFSQVFVLGAPRSGTTFLSSLLEHTRFGKPVESHFITKYQKRLKRYGDLEHDANLERLAADILKERPVMQWDLQVEPRELVADCRGPKRYTSLVNQLFARRRRSGLPHCWGDKTPHYIGDFDILHALFPDARYLYIVRDGRDVAASLLKMPWGPANVVTCAERWTSLNTLSPTLQRLVAEGTVLQLHYEALVSDPEPHITRIHDFLDERIEPSELRSLAATARSSSKLKWKTQMSPRHVARFESVAGDMLQHLGYETSGTVVPLPRWRRSLYHLHEKLYRAVFLFRVNVIDGIRIRFLGASPFAD